MTFHGKVFWRNNEKMIGKIFSRLEWYINAKPYRYIVYSMMLNAFESVLLIYIYLKVV